MVSYRFLYFSSFCVKIRLCSVLVVLDRVRSSILGTCNIFLCWPPEIHEGNDNHQMVIYGWSSRKHWEENGRYFIYPLRSLCFMVSSCKCEPNGQTSLPLRRFPHVPRVSWLFHEVMPWEKRMGSAGVDGVAESEVREDPTQLREASPRYGELGPSATVQGRCLVVTLTRV